MEVYDSLNNQFRLHYYIAKLNANLLQYLENNNIDINYYCFFSKIIGEKHYIITSKTTKRMLNGYRLVTIENVEKDNNIFEYNGRLDIIFENIHIKITSIMENINDVAKELGIVISNFDSAVVSNLTIDCTFDYDKDILESNITAARRVVNLHTLCHLENLKIIIFGSSYNQIIGVNVLPTSLQALTFGTYYDQIIGVNMLPTSLQALTFGSRYNQTIGENVLPTSLQTLTFGTCYDQIIHVHVLPNSLQTLTFGSRYNQTIGENVLPGSLQTLTFGSLYNTIILVNVLPNSLQTLTFGYSYDKIIGENVLPNSLRTLIFGWTYNQLIGINVLPNSLQAIWFNFYTESCIFCKKNIITKTFQNIVKYISVKN
jgi:hypothetical protein